MYMYSRDDAFHAIDLKSSCAEFEKFDIKNKKKFSEPWLRNFTYASNFPLRKFIFLFDFLIVKQLADCLTLSVLGLNKSKKHFFMSFSRLAKLSSPL